MPRATGRAGLVAAFLVLTVAALPPALLGGLAVPMGLELGFDARTLGVAVAAFWLAAGATSPPAGRRGDVAGWVPLAFIGLALTGVAALAMSLNRWGGLALVGVMALAGAGMAACSQASNLALVTEVSAERLGQAFGIKQSAPAAAWMLAGLAVPLAAVVWGWRSAWLLVVVAVPLVALVVRRFARMVTAPASAGENAEPDAVAQPSSGPRWTLVGAFALGTATISALTTFGLTTLMSSGLTPSAAGYVVAAAGALALLGRVAAGSWLDRRRPSMVPATVLLLASTVGLVLLAVPLPTSAVLGLVVALAAGSGWPPVVLVIIVRTWSDAPGRATGRAAIGSAAGAVLGPLLFGAVASSAGLGWAWGIIALCAAGAALMMQAPLLPSPIVVATRDAELEG